MEQIEINPDAERAAAHVIPNPRGAQRWQHAVTDEDVAAVMYAIETGEADIWLNRAGRWVGGQWISQMRTPTRVRLHWVVSEMIRTGLLRHIRANGEDALIPARVHYVDTDGWSMCHFTGEDLGPMRSRLTDDFALVDCLECQAAVARGHARGL